MSAAAAAVAVLVLFLSSTHGGAPCRCLDTDKLSCVGVSMRYLDGLVAACPSVKDLSLSRSSLPELPEHAIRAPKLLKLSLPDNGLGAIHRRAFLGLLRLRHIYLARNNLHHLHRDTFAATPRLATIDVSSNMLSDLTALRSISSLEHLSVMFNALTILPHRSITSPNLTHLWLSSNELTTIESGAFEALPNLRELDLSDNFITNLDPNTFKHNLKLLELKLSYNKISKLTFIHDIPNLKYLSLHDNAVSHLPDDAFDGMPHLCVVNLKNNAIATIGNRAFEGLRGLVDLNLSWNDIKSLESSTLKNTAQMQRLNLAHNRISHVDFLHTVTRLIDLNLADNVINVLPSGVFPTSLESLDLSGNMLVLVMGDTFRGLDQLAKLNLSNAEILHLDPGILVQMPNLTELDMRNNHLSEMLNLYDVTRLSLLHLSGNNINILHQDAFRGVSLPHTDIDITRNGITEIGSKDFLGLEDVHSLQISRNNITYIHKDAFFNFSYFGNFDASYNIITEIDFIQDIYTLRYCDLSHNSINILQNETFSTSNISHLHGIDLSNNAIYKVERRAFQYLNNVWDLNLSKNNISFLSPDTFMNTTSLWDLNISHNNITEVKSFCNIPSLRSLNISFNKITILPNGSFSQLNISHLGTFDLSNNAIHTVSQFAFQGLTLLSHLNLSANRIITIPPDTFSHVPILTSLDMSRNILTAVGAVVRSALSLVKCDLSRNAITSLGKGSWSHTVRIINLSHNQIAIVDPDVFQDLRHLEQLELSWNHIATLDADTFLPCTALLKLDLRGNLLSQVNALNIPSLKHLYLAHNSISHLSDDTFSAANITMLALLDLANNSLIAVQSKTFQCLPLLKYLDLSRNNLPNLDPTTFRNNTVLWAIDISNNRLSNVEYIRRIPSLRVLTLSNNSITTLPRKSFSSSKFSKLTYIDVSKNLINRVHNGALSGLVKLRYLDVSKNNISALYSGVWSDIRRLKTLRRGHNPLAERRYGPKKHMDMRGLAEEELKALAIDRRLSEQREVRHL